MIQKNEQIELALDLLDVERIQSVLTFLNIKWVDVETGINRVPTSKEIRVIAEHCMRLAFDSETKTFNMGGFEAEVVNNTVSIKYILTQATPLSKLLG